MSIFDDKPLCEDSDAETFAQAIEGVKPLVQDKIPQRTKTALRKNKELAYQRQQATMDQSQVIDGLSSEAVDIVESDQELLFAIPGVQLKTMQRLRRGQIHWEEGIDLHGMSIELARDQLSDFIRSAHRKQCQCVIVVHGKAYSQSGQQPLIKSYTNDWLRQMPQVLAFCSAQPKDGGAGALYVMLRKPKT
ncbi:MAG: Smr/MutS family protein [Pseudomonadales bacterium]